MLDQPISLIFDTHNWRHLWESPTQLWFSRDLRREMSKGWSRSYAESGSKRSSRGSTWREKRYKRHEDRDHEQEDEQSGLGERSNQTRWIVSGASEHERFDERDEELECLCRLVRDLELEARGRRRGRDRDDQEEGSISGGGRYRAGSHQSGSYQHQERLRSREYAN